MHTYCSVPFGSTEKWNGNENAQNVHFHLLQYLANKNYNKYTRWLLIGQTMRTRAGKVLLERSKMEQNRPERKKPV